jgi:hypothetical protein
MSKGIIAAVAVVLSLSVLAFEPHHQRPREVRGRNRARQLSYEQYIDAAFTNNTDVVLNVNTKDTSQRNGTAPYLYGLVGEPNTIAMLRS